VIASYKSLQSAKNIIINKLKRVSDVGTFIEKDGGLEATSPEGFMAIQEQWATKLVDRLEFSKNNFTVPKNFGRESSK
jgi:hypothetical protein